MRIGLLPALGRGVARFVGNAALAGAKRALLSRDELAKAQRLRDCTEHIELSSEPGYTDCFTEHMMFPESECAEL